jgi:predicted transcriptional regulator
MSVSAAERDSLRERAFAMAMQKVPYREIAKRLGINKSTVVEYVRIEKQRRSHDRDAESAIRDVVTMLRTSLQDLYDQLLQTTGTGPMTGLAKVKLAESIRSTARDLTMVYGVTLPKIAGEEIAMDRLMEMVQKEIDAPPIGYPDVSEDAIYEKQLKSPAEIMGEWEEMRRVGEERFRQKDAERDRLREAQRRMEEEFEASPFQSWQELLDSPDYADEGDY